MDTDENDIIMTGQQIDFLKSEGIDTIGFRNFIKMCIQKTRKNFKNLPKFVKKKKSIFNNTIKDALIMSQFRVVWPTPTYSNSGTPTKMEI